MLKRTFIAVVCVVFGSSCVGQDNAMITARVESIRQGDSPRACVRTKDSLVEKKSRTGDIPSRLQAEPSRGLGLQPGYSCGFRVPKTVVSRSENTVFGVGTLFINPGR